MAETEMAVSRTAVAAMASLAPLWGLMSLKASSRVRLDNLHIVLAQLLILTFFRFAINLTPRRVADAASKTQASIKGAPTTATSTDVATAKPKKMKRKKVVAKQQKGENPAYPFSLMDASLYRFLSVVDPKHLEKLGPLPAGSRKPPEPLALSEWQEMFNSDGVVVLKHPKLAGMYAICYKFADADIRKLWEMLIDITKRPSWDALCDGAESMVDLGEKGATKRPTQRVGTISWMGMKGMFPVKAKDLVLMSVVAQLPPSPSTIPSTPEKPVLRLVCATTSVESDLKPPNKGGFSRMELDISGFVLEEDGEGGVLLTQITDLSGLGNWVPTKIISMVTQTMIPKSLARIGRRAKELELEGHRADLEGDNWLPPMLGGWNDAKGEAAEGGDAAAEEEVEEEEEDEDEEDGPVTSRSLNDLLQQLRLVTARLGALEAQRGHRRPVVTASWLSRLWPFSSSSVSTDKEADVGAGGGIGFWLENGAVSALGGAVGALSVFWAATLYARRR